MEAGQEAGERIAARAAGEQLLAGHRELRAQLAGIRAALADGGASPPDPRAARASLALPDQLRLRCLTYCAGLHHHHSKENGAFAVFERRFPELAPVIERLRAEHQRVYAALDRLTALLESEEGGDLPRVREELERTVDGLEAHFAYEEEHLLPTLGVPRPATPR
ncbi:hemerythrin domain-containing protein [Streptomyces sp. PT12]|uniref:hemerythrin domain-containing protein n=1 Tax=Streptomyces sp. PT12 TaxID=1510197 RepID=UPI0015EF5AE2|nr:hemerythrin domain-containing protein [Streptomyces sp. PT12]